ncbi:hypothetical protein KAJ27_12845 [bacterium]|nr:hypothetical protein [bacterium]
MYKKILEKIMPIPGLLYYQMDHKDIFLNDDKKLLKQIDMTYRDITRKLVEELDNAVYDKDGIILKNPIQFPSKYDEQFIEVKSIGFNFLPLFMTEKFLNEIKYIQFVLTDCSLLKKQGNDNDTIYTGKIVMSYLSKIYSDDIEVFHEIVIDRDPHNFDEMIIFFEAYFKKNDFGFYKYHLVLNTGLQPVIYGLSHGMQSRYPTLLYVTNDGKKISKCTSLGRLRMKQKQNMIIRALDDINYSSAIDMFDDSPLKMYPGIKMVLKTLEPLLNSSYEEARKYLQDIPDSYGKEKDLLSESIFNILTILKSDPLSYQPYFHIYNLLLSHIEVIIHKKYYVELNARICGLIELFLKNFIEKVVKIKIQKTKGRFCELAEYMDANPEVDAIVKKNNKKVFDRDTNVEIPRIPTKEVLFAISEYAVIKGIVKGRMLKQIKLFSELFRRISFAGNDNMSLIDIRNNGPYAHNILGLTKERFEDAFHYTDLELKELVIILTDFNERKEQESVENNGLSDVEFIFETDKKCIKEMKRIKEFDGIQLVVYIMKQSINLVSKQHKFKNIFKSINGMLLVKIKSCIAKFS